MKPTLLISLTLCIVASGCKSHPEKRYIMIVDTDEYYRYVYCDSFQMISPKEVIIWDGKTKQVLKAFRSITPESN